MRTIQVEADQTKITVRGRMRRNPAIEQQYVVALKQVHKDTKDLVPVRSEGALDAVVENPGWTLVGLFNQFVRVASRIAMISVGDNAITEPFSGTQLAGIFESWANGESLPDRSDLWSLVEDAISTLDKVPETTDPNSDSSSTPK